MTARLRRLAARVVARTWPVRQLHCDGGRYRNRATRGPAGVNLIGFARGDFGIGQHLRSTAASLTAAGVPIAVVDDPTTLHSRGDTTLEHLLEGEPVYRGNLFCLNSDRILDMWHRQRGYFRGRYNIGYGYWELSDFPVEWLPVMNILDEMWAPSRHVRDVLDAKSALPVLHMPLAVEVAATHAMERRELGLPDDAFVFCFVFDFSSTVERKNPLAVVEAFRRAFPEPTPTVRLLLKTKTNESVAYQRAGREVLQQAVAGDPRIVVVDRLLPRQQVIALMAASDAYVSLHRAEGFGLGMAEAMALGKPVVATAYSGNLDFMDDGCALLVDYSMEAVPPGAGFGLEGQSQWARPDPTDAARAMRRLVDDREFAATLGARGRERISSHFTHRRMGSRMHARLALIGLLED